MHVLGAVEGDHRGAHHRVDSASSAIRRARPRRTRSRSVTMLISGVVVRPPPASRPRLLHQRGDLGLRSCAPGRWPCWTSGVCGGPHRRVSVASGGVGAAPKWWTTRRCPGRTAPHDRRCSIGTAYGGPPSARTPRAPRLRDPVRRRGALDHDLVNARRMSSPRPDVITSNRRSAAAGRPLSSETSSSRCSRRDLQAFSKLLVDVAAALTGSTSSSPSCPTPCTRAARPGVQRVDRHRRLPVGGDALDSVRRSSRRPQPTRSAPRTRSAPTGLGPARSPRSATAA